MYAEPAEEKMAMQAIREQPVHLQTSSLETAHTRLAKHMAELVERLQPVLAPENGAVPFEAVGEDRRPTSPLAARLEDRVDEVNRLIDRLADVTARLEV